VYAALEKPWVSSSKKVASADADAGVDEAPSSGKRHGKRHKRRGTRAGSGSGELQEIDETIELSAADRQMIWRGPAIKLPEKNMDFGSGGGGRSLDQGEIDQGISGGQRALIGCIADARGQAELSANIIVKLLVEGTGKVSKVRVRAPSYLMKNGLFECAGNAARHMRFPGTGAATVVTIPLDLS
jgi:hypothetical protein